MSTSYGSFASIIATATTLAAAGGAITFIVKGHNRWEPSEQDLPHFFERLAAIVVFTSLAVLWYYFAIANRGALRELAIIAIVLLGLCLVLGGAYYFVFGLSRYIVEVAISKTKTESRPIVGGFWLRAEMREWIRKHGKGETIQELLRGNQYNPDRLWNRGARMLAKVTLLFLYVGFLGCAAATVVILSILVEQAA